VESETCAIYVFLSVDLGIKKPYLVMLNMAFLFVLLGSLSENRESTAKKLNLAIFSLNFRRIEQLFASN